MALHRNYNYYDAEDKGEKLIRQQAFKCKEHSLFVITEEQDKDVMEYINYNCPICNKISNKADYVGIRLKGLPNTKS